MTEHASPPESAKSDGSRSGGLRFDERLSVPWWWYVLAAGVGALLGAEVHMGYPGLRAWLGYSVAVPLLIATLVWLGRTRVRVGAGELRVGGATLPLSRIGRVEVVAKADKQTALGPELDPAAYLMHRAWIGPVVRVEVTGQTADAAYPTPYWIFSVRGAERLAAVLRD